MSLLPRDLYNSAVNEDGIATLSPYFDHADLGDSEPLVLSIETCRLTTRTARPT